MTSQWRSWLPATLQWRHNDHDGVSNHHPHGCLLNRLFRRTSKKTSKLRVTGLCVGKSPGPVNSPHKGPITRKMFPFDDVISQSVRATIQSPITARVKSVSPCLHPRIMGLIHSWQYTWINSNWYLHNRDLDYQPVHPCCDTIAYHCMGYIRYPLFSSADGGLDP